MAGASSTYGLLLAAVLFGIGFTGLLVRRNLIVVLACIEIMLNAAGLAFVVAGARWGRPDGQVMFLFVLAMAAAEVTVGLAIAIRFRQSLHSLEVDDEMKG
jgi:NADH-quinone oxidoreductase subunit K